MNWPYVHLILNHVPVLGSVFLLLLLAIGLVRRSAEIQRVSLWGVVVLTLVAIPIKFTGDAAQTAVKGRAGFDDREMEHHEQAADQATTGIFLAGVAATLALFLARSNRPLPRWAVVVTLILLLLTFALMARTAASGGRIRHPEAHPGLFYPRSPDS